MTELSLLKQALALIEEKKGEDAVVIDLREEPIPTSFFLITHGDNTVHVKAIVSHLRQNMTNKNMRREGLGERRWVILDYGEIVVHVFQRDIREFYDIDSLWSDRIADLDDLRDD